MEVQNLDGLKRSRLQKSLRKGIGSRYPRSKPALPTRRRRSYRPQFHAGRILLSLVETLAGTGQAEAGPDRGVEGAPRKQVVPRKYRETGRSLVGLEGTYLLPKVVVQTLEVEPSRSSGA